MELQGERHIGCRHLEVEVYKAYLEVKSSTSGTRIRQVDDIKMV